MACYIVIVLLLALNVWQFMAWRGAHMRIEDLEFSRRYWYTMAKWLEKQNNARST